MNIKINKKDDIILKILYYFVTEEDYKPVIINGLDNEIWLENMETDPKLIRININYIHNNEQLKNDTYKAKMIMKSIKKTTFSLKINMINLLLDTGDAVDMKKNDFSVKNIETIKVDKISDFKKNKTINEFFPRVKEAILNEKMDPVEFFKLTDNMNQTTMKKEKKLAKIFSPKKPVATYVLIVLNLVVFMYMFMYGKYDSVVGAFANNSLLVTKNFEYYRLLTSMFLHADVMHILLNMIALFQIGPVVERYYGKWKFLLIYFVSGILGSLFSCVFMDAGAFSLGASGAIFGLLGSIFYFTYYYRATLNGILRSSIVPVILINLFLGIIIPGISVSAHIGGLLGGLLISMAIGIGDKNRTRDQANGAIVLVLMAAFMLYMLITK